MSPTRPVYKVTVENIDQAWTYSTTHGDPAPDRNDVTAILMDDFQLTWGLEDSAPSQLENDMASVKLYCKTAADVPAIEVGDTLVINLQRPGPDDDLLPYMRFVGRATDPKAVTSLAGIELTIGAVGMYLDISTEVDFGAGDNFSTGVEAELAAFMNTRLPDLEADSLYHSPMIFDRNVRTFGKAPAQDIITKLLNSCITTGATAAGVLRYAWDWLAIGAARPAGWAGTGLTSTISSRLIYYVQPWALVMPAPLTLIEDDTDHDMVVLGPDDATVRQVATLNARYCELPAEWTKSRGDVINIANITYTATPGGVNTEASTTVKDASSISRYGPTSRDIPTYVLSASTPTIASAFSNPAPDAKTWAIDSLTVKPSLMDDDELDELASVFFPQVEPIDDIGGRYIILTDIDATGAVAGRDLAMQITGCTFSISKGELVITPRVQAVEASLATSITWADLAAGSLANTTWDDAGVHYIDPSLQWDELTYTDA